jgi:hypothetical protein
MPKIDMKTIQGKLLMKSLKSNLTMGADHMQFLPTISSPK